ncbi:hypothetical protein C477_22690 [Haloterrigena salina JCM 13891]|uniref:Uncharacterized protein n=1 Tax=Haloterrigena salina JCM 13891 TaxID=1227488 RepID=M0BT71_9EURY|nr:hypothetical protein [Haloterrigena salina]ELZ13312.1 hypothetical protein C477_22690 [Haloterrigena salina JCM 13891]
MQTLEVTDEQYAVIQQLREEISEQVVGKYGFVRERDAVQFLIDNLEGYPDLDVDIDTELDSSATDDVAASVGAAIDGESASDDLEAVSYIEDDSVDGDDGTAVDAATDAEVIDPDSEPEPEPDAESEDETVDSSDEDAESESDTADATDADDGDDANDDSSDGDGSADDDDMLDEMMSLLETHDDKWAESNAADYRYEVELPDGTTEQVQTKDDVRALLFKNYR